MNNNCETSGESDKPKSGMELVKAELLEIMAVYHQQEARGGIDTPGGLEHMGDVWRLLLEWEELAKAESK
jgi:hypothetical protein